MLRDSREQKDIALDEIRWLVDVGSKMVPQDYRLAIIVSQDVVYGLGRMYQTRVSEQFQAKVFRDIDEARQWLQRPFEPKETSG